MYRSNAAVWSREQWQIGSSRQGVLLGSTIQRSALLFVPFLQSQPNHVHVGLTKCIKWWFMYMLNKLLPGVSFCKTNFLKCCKAQTSTSREFEKVLFWLMLFFFFFFFLFFSFFLSHCQVVSMQMDELYCCHCHICSSVPIGLIQLPHRRTFFCQKKSWHVGVHRILINGSLQGRGLGLTLSQILWALVRRLQL